LRVLPIFAGMYENGQPASKFSALNSFFLLTGVLGFIYFVFAAWFMRQFGSPAQTELQNELNSHRHLWLLAVSLVELVLGVFIRQSSRQAQLFLQCLSAMFLLCAHGLFIFQFHQGLTGKPAIVKASWPVAMLTLAVFLQAPLLFERFRKRSPRLKKKNDDDWYK
jgi:hypothetical protein